MTISRLLILQAVLLCGLGTVFVIPREAGIQPSRVNMALPDVLGDFVGTPAAVTQKERDTLAPDTQFARRIYDDGFGDHIWVSIVLSGNDLDNSIHRPERCLPAQGWTIADSSSLTIPVPGAPGGRLPVTRLHNYRQVNVNGHVVDVYNLNYYWFVGYSDITASHIQREFIDMKDRLLHGYNQRWAFVTVASNITKGSAEDEFGDGKDEAQTDAMLQKVIAEIYPVIVGQPGGSKPAS
jgi:EpsI family protein